MSSRSGLLLLPVLVASLAFAPAASGQNKRILWDVHHGSFGPYTVAGNFSTMASLLKAAGYDVVESSAGVLSEDLSTYDAVIVSVLSAFASPYTAAEAQAIRSYANGGGGVLLVGDTQFAWPGNVNPVAQLFDITLGNPSVSSSDTWVTNLSASEEMFQGVTSIYFLAGGVLQVGPDAASVGSTAAGETMIARWNLGRVVALGDGNAFENAFIGSGDNIAYLTKLFDYLTDGCVSGLGDGSPGSGGLVPLLLVDPESCAGALSLQLRDAVGGASSLLLAGTKAAQIPTVGGVVHVDVFTPPFLAVPIPLGGAPGAAGAGFALLGQDLAPYLPLTLTLQFAVFDAGAPGGVALSNGLEVQMAP